ncbi:MAG: 50S ribosomal protein L19e [Candidatus Diapherotrites archaeon CG08_land_8_20_14_0_20_30_16]|nr:MAG: 50S ribosomal protein L19e [Candidatus Diapherotrites archaeon CG08_land_8_20_14_0_20_30_16]
MNMKSARRIVARKRDVGISRLKVDSSALKKIKEAITGSDLETLMKDNVFTIKGKGQSKGRARVLKAKKRLGRRKGKGTRRGTRNSRTKFHENWIKKVRAQRKYILELSKNKKIDKEKYRDLYKKIKGGFFRSKGHIDSYLSKK